MAGVFARARISNGDSMTFQDFLALMHAQHPVTAQTITVTPENLEKLLMGAWRAGFIAGHKAGVSLAEQQNPLNSIFKGGDN
jgi:hypothetical protein